MQWSVVATLVWHAGYHIFSPPQVGQKIGNWCKYILDAPLNDSASCFFLSTPHTFLIIGQTLVLYRTHLKYCVFGFVFGRINLNIRLYSIPAHLGFCMQASKYIQQGSSRWRSDLFDFQPVLDWNIDSLQLTNFLSILPPELSSIESHHQICFLFFSM